MKRAIIVAVVCILSETSLATAEERVPVITQDANGKPMVVEVSAKEYSLRYKSTVSTMNDSLMEALNYSAHKNQQWHLRTISVGIAVNMEFGVGTMKVGAVPKSRLIFTNSINPPIP